MAGNVKAGKRTRAWILLQVDSPETAAQKLYEALHEQGDDRYVVIRADVVDYAYNVVVPVDAENPATLEAVRREIVEISGAKQSVILPVLQTFPRVPHDAHGYITAEESQGGHERNIQPGRQHWSPGQNAWG